jgi:S1-C subfamily serine protease
MRALVRSLCLCVSLLGAASLHAQTAAPPGAAQGAGASDAARQAAVSAVVRVEAIAIADAPSAASLGPRRSGSGVVIGERLVLTIGYLLLETETVEVTTAQGRRVPATVAGYDHASGFGLVRTALPLGLPALELGDSDRVTERDTVLTVGQGEREATELVIESPIFTFPPVNNWSGAALIAGDGRLVGIGSLVVNDAGEDRRGLPGNLFVPVNLLKPILADLLAKGRRSAPVQPWLGMSTEFVRGNLMVVRVSRGSPAERAGVDPGDIVLSVGGQRVAGQADFYRRLWGLGPAGTEVTLRLLKGGEVRDLPVRSVDRAETLARPAGV